LDQGCTEQILSEDYFDFIVANDEIPEGLSTLPGFCYDMISNVYSVVYVPISKLPGKIIQDFRYSIIPKCYGILNMNSLTETGVAKIQSNPYLNLLGSGVLVGIVDTGIDYTHQAFKNPDGTTRIISIWDQTINGDGSKPTGFYYGTEYTQDQINIALASSDPLSLVPSIDRNGHGTSLAGIAAGTRNEAENFTGSRASTASGVPLYSRRRRHVRRLPPARCRLQAPAARARRPPQSHRVAQRSPPARRRGHAPW
jgi:hypothetical protein